MGNLHHLTKRGNDSTINTVAQDAICTLWLGCLSSSPRWVSVNGEPRERTRNVEECSPPGNLMSFASSCLGLPLRPASTPVTCRPIRQPPPQPYLLFPALSWGHLGHTFRLASPPSLAPGSLPPVPWDCLPGKPRANQPSSRALLPGKPRMHAVSLQPLKSLHAPPRHGSRSPGRTTYSCEA